MNLKETIATVSKSTTDLIESIAQLQKYKANTHYARQFGAKLAHFQKAARTLELFLHRIGKTVEEQKVATVVSAVLSLASNYAKLSAELGSFQKTLIDLEVIAETAGLPSLEIPATVPYNEVRLDLQEAVKDYDNGCYFSAQVMCRRGYEGALREKYIEFEKKEPFEDSVCRHCTRPLASNIPISVTKLHKWAVGKKIIHAKLQNIGLLVPGLGAIGAHPASNPIPREKQVAKLTLEATFALMTLIYSSSSP